ncbi:MAG: hypothetical protein AB1521_11900 [Bacteroidota bacterium]
MIPYRFLLFTLIAFLISNQVHPQASEDFTNIYSTISERIIRTSLTENIGYGWLKELCEIGPRLSGSDQSLKAINWAREKMVEHKFDKVWLQPVMVPKWIRGKTELAQISKSGKYSGKMLNITALGGSDGTSNNGITAQIIEVGSFDELKEKSELAKGKIVFFNRSFDQGLVNTFEGMVKQLTREHVGR